MDRSLEFFLNIKTNNSNRNVFGVKPTTKSATVRTVTVDRQGRETTTSSQQENYTLYPSAFKTWFDGPDPKLQNLQYINFRGVSGTNDYDPLTTSKREQSETSITSIIAWSKQYPAAQLREIDFAYLKDIGVYPPNRMAVVRRFGENPAPNDLLTSGASLVPTSVIVGYIGDNEEVALDISFSENWETSSKDVGFLNVINDIIGVKQLKLPTFDGLSNLGQSIAVNVGKSLGLLTQNVNPLGDPDVLHEAAYRKANYEGLKFDMSVKVTTEYLQKYIDGVDPHAAMLDVIGNVVSMGTSDSKFIVTGDGTDKINSIIRDLQNGRIDKVTDAVITAVSDTLMTAVEKVTNFVKTVANQDDPAKAADVAKTELFDAAQALVRTALSKYSWKLRGAIGAMSGAPTAPWHVTLGNPKAPWFSCGNMVCTDVKLELLNTYSSNDFPERIRVTVTLKPGRTLGMQEITSMFNAGKGRIYHKPTDKTRYTFVDR